MRDLDTPSSNRSLRMIHDVISCQSPGSSTSSGQSTITTHFSGVVAGATTTYTHTHTHHTTTASPQKAHKHTYTRTTTAIPPSSRHCYSHTNAQLWWEMA